MTASAPPLPRGSRWLDTASHRAWLDGQFGKVVAFALRSIRPAGGFHWLDAAGVPLPGKTPQLFLTARMTYAGCLAVVRGVPGGGALVDHGVAALLGLHLDREHGGWISDPATAPRGRKAAYDHVHVGFAAAHAVVAGHPQGPELLERAIAVIEERLWREDERALAESFAADWTDPEPYRGANSAMHGVEAFLAIGAATGDRGWYRRALDLADRLINRSARSNAWLLPEHYDEQWRAELAYNEAEPAHPFRPYGWTIGHAFEWSRLLMELDAALGPGEVPWLGEASVALCDTALGGWAVDGRPGFVYTTDWQRRAVVSNRLHWPLCEAIQAVAVLGQVAAAGQPTGTVAGEAGRWEGWYRRLWDHAAAHFIDPSGMWANELGPDLVEAPSMWPGRPDVYHTAGALLTPQAPVGPCLTQGFLDS